MNTMKLTAPLCAALAYFPSHAWAAPVLGSDLASVTVLGASTVTNGPTSTIGGIVGVWSSVGANAITGFHPSPGVAVSDSQVTGGLLHAGTAQAQLDGGGNANAAWTFQMPSTLITSPNSAVSVINTGSGAGVYWNFGSSAAIDVNTTFLGNILALTSITMNTTATDLCGRALANTGAVTSDHNVLSGTCTGVLAGGNGLSGGLDVTGTMVAFLPSAPVGGPSRNPRPKRSCSPASESWPS